MENEVAECFDLWEGETVARYFKAIRYRQQLTPGEFFAYKAEDIQKNSGLLYDTAYLLLVNYHSLIEGELLPDALAVWQQLRCDTESPLKLRDLHHDYERFYWGKHMQAIWPRLTRALLAALNLPLIENLRDDSYTPQQILEAWYLVQGSGVSLEEALAS